MKLIVSAHGMLAKEVVNSAGMVFGAIDDLDIVTFVPGENAETLKARYKECELACAGIDDHLYIYAEEKDAPDKEEIISFISEKTGLNPGVFEVFCIDHIPVSESGKIKYKELEDVANVI